MKIVKLFWEAEIGDVYQTGNHYYVRVRQCPQGRCFSGTHDWECLDEFQAYAAVVLAAESDS